jgi:hypothetical protein
VPLRVVGVCVEAIIGHVSGCVVGITDGTDPVVGRREGQVGGLPPIPR